MLIVKYSCSGYKVTDNILLKCLSHCFLLANELNKTDQPQFRNLVVDILSCDWFVERFSYCLIICEDIDDHHSYIHN